MKNIGELLSVTMSNAVGLYANKSNALVKNVKCYINKDRSIVPFWNEKTMMVPLEFFVNSIEGSISEGVGEGEILIEYKGKTLTIKIDENKAALNWKSFGLEKEPMVKNGVVYAPLSDLCKALGLYCFSDESNLIIYGEKQLDLTWVKDGALLRKIAESFVYDDVNGSEIVQLIKKKHPNMGHPRLIMTEEKFAAIRENLASDNPDPYYVALLKKVKAQADECLDKRASGYEIRDGVRLLYVSQEVKGKILALAITYNLTLEEKYAERAWLEMYNAACFVDWHPWHMLDVGEMTTALAFGYDWLYDYLGEYRRKFIREAMVENGFNALANDYNGLVTTGDDHKNLLHRSWYWRGGNPINNWRFIAGGGTAVGAIAICDELSGKDLKTCEQILSQSLIDIRESLSLFAPAGAYPEGIGYWGYAMSYFTYHIGSLISATGKDFGYTDVPGLRHTPNFVLAVNGSASVFNYGDAGRGSANVGWAIMFFVHLYGNMSAARARINLILNKNTGTAEDFFYYDPSFIKADNQNDISLDTYLQDSEVFATRSGFDENDMYIALHCGDNFADHGQYDMGVFVLDSMGENFFLDLGPDNYNLPNRFTDTYRYRAEGHNTIVINPDQSPGQVFESTALIDKHESKMQGAYAFSDITAAYEPWAIKMRRGIKLDHNRSMATLQDEVRLKESSDFWWFAHTDASITISEDKKSAYLNKNGKTLLAEIISGENATFSVMQAKSLPTSPKQPGQADDSHINKLTIHIPECKDLDLAVTFKNYDESYKKKNYSSVFTLFDEWKI